MLDNYRRFFYKLVFLISILLGVVKLISSSDYQLIISTWSFEVALFAILILVDLIAVNCLRQSFLRWLSFVGLWCLTIFHAFVSFSQSLYLDDAFEREMSLGRIDSEMIAVFFAEILPIPALIIGVVCIVLVVMAAHFWNPRWTSSKNKTVFYLLFFIAVCTTSMMSFSSSFTSPYVHTLEDILSKKIALSKQLPSTKIELDLSARGIFDPEVFEKLQYNRILVFVMESVMLKNYKEEIRSRPNSFLARMKDKSEVYENYFTTNQDSRTALTAMLSSILVPYEAYVKKGDVPPYYTSILAKENLVSGFNRAGYHTEFLISSMETPTIGHVYPWQERTNIDTFQTDGKYLCLHILKNQRGCEDMAIAGKYMQQVQAHEKVFMFQEFVFGHGSRYERLSKKTRIQYYNEYLGYIYDKLREKKLTEDTLFVLVGDHGLRKKTKVKKMGKYKVPLVFLADNLTGSRELALQNHLHFSPLLLATASGSQDSARVLKESFVVGSTGSGLVSYLNSNQHFFTIRSLDNLRVIQALGIEDTQIATKAYAFKIYRDAFATLYGTPYNGTASRDAQP